VVVVVVAAAEVSSQLKKSVGKRIMVMIWDWYGLHSVPLGVRVCCSIIVVVRNCADQVKGATLAF
jgi:hypothetical protein